MSNKTANASDANTVANNIFNAHEANNFEEVIRLWSEVTRMSWICAVETHSKTRGDIKISAVLVNAVQACPGYLPRLVPDRGSEDPAQVLSAIRDSQCIMQDGLLTREEFLTRVEEILGPTDAELRSRGIEKTVWLH